MVERFVWNVSCCLPLRNLQSTHSQLNRWIWLKLAEGKILDFRFIEHVATCENVSNHFWQLFPHFGNLIWLKSFLSLITHNLIRRFSTSQTVVSSSVTWMKWDYGVSVRHVLHVLYMNLIHNPREWIFDEKMKWTENGNLWRRKWFHHQFSLLSIFVSDNYVANL